MREQLTKGGLPSALAYSYDDNNDRDYDRQSNRYQGNDREDLPRMRPMLTFCSLEYWMPEA